MKPEFKSQQLLGVTRSKAKMFEYGIPEKYHLKIIQDPAKLFTISIGLLGDIAATINRNETDPESLSELRLNLLFSARFFDSYIQSNLDQTLDIYLMLLGSASYYLCDLPGSSSVLAKHIKSDWLDLDGAGLENLLLWLLQSDYRTYTKITKGPYDRFINHIYQCILQFFRNGTREEILLRLVKKLRNIVYKFGTPRQLLFGDVIAAVLRKKLENSTWKALPLYSGLSSDKWLSVLQKESFVKELWPAQHLLGKAGVFKGDSAIVQMPTSAGKTKAIELILRSAFLANRISLAIIVAPFRALCHEIKNSLVEAFQNESTEVNEISDAPQTDFIIDELLEHPQILVVTPEKLLYVLRHTPELASHVGLLVFDEGHQFDSGTRGITYELLLTSLRSMIPKGTQKIMISAVISNAEAVGEWLNDDPNVVEGTKLNPTFRSLGFASWIDQMGRIEYVDIQNVEQNEFFVPRVIEKFKLEKKKWERTDRFFPIKSNGQDIALFLGLKLVQNGSIAVFCGRKSTAAKICERAMDVIERGYPFALPSEFSNKEEVERLTLLHIANLGISAVASQSAAFGIFSHHGNTPHGIRMAVEYAIREDLVHFVVCTSTLAQGVNLPIRYLIVTSVYQGHERIKVRDFHNLIGRAGRAGMHTEGSILFADPVIYDKRKSFHENWHWKQVKELLEPGNSEPCISNLISIFNPIKSDDEHDIFTMEALDFVEAYISGPSEVEKMAANICELHGKRNFSRDSVNRQFAWKISLISAVESFLLSHWDETEKGLSEADINHLAESTLAFFLSDDQKKEHIRTLFHILAKNILKNITDPTLRKIYGRTLYGLQNAQAIEMWVHSNASNLLSVDDETELLDLVWPLFTRHLNNSILTKFDKPEVINEVAHGWINGDSFSALLEIIHNRRTKMIWGTIKREFKIDHVVEVCEGTLAYGGVLLLGALNEFIETLELDGKVELIRHLQLLQKRLKYGLPTATTIALFELGFSDRVISQELSLTLQISTGDKKEIITILKEKIDKISVVMGKYPKYYQEILLRF